MTQLLIVIASYQTVDLGKKRYFALSFMLHCQMSRRRTQQRSLCLMQS